MFDVTATGVTGHFRPSRLPFTDDSGRPVTNEADWNRARNQQRNWETLTQLISLRTQVNHGHPRRKDGRWIFEFETDSDTVYYENGDNLALLKRDCDMVPMLTGLHEKPTDAKTLLVDQNIWFDILPINKE